MLNAIINAIHKAFPNHKIYIENVEQGLKTPCFFISEISAQGNRVLGNRHQRICQFMVQFLPNEKNSYADCSTMLHNLLILLVDVGIYHAVKLNGEIVDNVLNFEVVYQEFIDITNYDIEDMNDYKHNINGVNVNG